MYLKINAPNLKEKSKSINFLKDLNRKIEDEKSWFRGDLKLDLSFFYQKNWTNWGIHSHRTRTNTHLLRPDPALGVEEGERFLFN